MIDNDKMISGDLVPESFNLAHPQDTSAHALVLRKTLAPFKVYYP